MGGERGGALREGSIQETRSTPAGKTLLKLFCVFTSRGLSPGSEQQRQNNRVSVTTSQELGNCIPQSATLGLSQQFSFTHPNSSKAEKKGNGDIKPQNAGSC